MSMAATCVAYDAETADPVAKLVLIELADWADERGNTVIVMSDLEKFSQSTAEKVERAIKRLTERGIIQMGDLDHKGRRRATIMGVTP